MAVLQTSVCRGWLEKVFVLVDFLAERRVDGLRLECFLNANPTGGKDEFKFSPVKSKYFSNWCTCNQNAQTQTLVQYPKTSQRTYTTYKISAFCTIGEK